MPIAQSMSDRLDDRGDITSSLGGLRTLPLRELNGWPLSRALNGVPNQHLVTGPLGRRRAKHSPLHRTRARVATRPITCSYVGVDQAWCWCPGIAGPGASNRSPSGPVLRLHREAYQRGTTSGADSVDDDGLDVSKLVGAQFRAVSSGPAHSYPYGKVLSAARRAALVNGRRHDRLIIEDDYDADSVRRAPIAR